MIIGRDLHLFQVQIVLDATKDELQHGSVIASFTRARSALVTSVLWLKAIKQSHLTVESYDMQSPFPELIGKKNGAFDIILT